jgi:small ubiquitin-related modifier
MEQESNEDNKHIILKVLGQDDSVVKFKFLRNAQLSKLMEVYCERAGICRDEARFIYKNVRIFDEDTPLSLRMQNGDTIDVGRIFGNKMYSNVKNEPTSSDKIYINLKVLGQDGSNVEFRVLHDDRFEKLINVYCNIANVSKEHIRFRFDGEPVNEFESPMSLHMLDGDTIEIFQEQISG